MFECIYLHIFIYVLHILFPVFFSNWIEFDFLQHIQHVTRHSILKVSTLV